MRFSKITCWLMRNDAVAALKAAGYRADKAPSSLGVQALEVRAEGKDWVIAIRENGPYMAGVPAGVAAVVDGVVQEELARDARERAAMWDAIYGEC